MTLTSINSPLCVFVTVAFSLLGVAQTMHLFFNWFVTGKSKNQRTAAFAIHMCHEASIILFLATSALITNYHDVKAVTLLGAIIPIAVLRCIGLVPLAFGLVSRALGNKSRILPVELVLFAMPSIAVLMNSERLYLASYALIGGQLTYRITSTIWNDEKMRRQTFTRFSIVDAINLLPSGILCLTSKGHSLVMNEAMRNKLTALELPIDPADLSKLWTKLVTIALSDEHSLKYNEHCLLIAMPDETYSLFERGPMNWNHEEHTAITSTDVTEAAELNKALEQSNKLISAASDEIKSSLEDVARIAQNEALLSLRAKVHDIIGQRLSILHRLLEDDAITDESLAEIKPPLNNLLDDLRIESCSAQAEFEGIISAFSLIDVKFELEGKLTQREDIARAFVAIIREATTNAVRHAQASTVRVAFDTSEREERLSVSNDYCVSQAKPGEGIGIPNMRKAIEALGGTLEISASPCFVVSAVVPLAESEQP